MKPPKEFIKAISIVKKDYEKAIDKISTMSSVGEIYNFLDKKHMEKGICLYLIMHDKFQKYFPADNSYFSVMVFITDHYVKNGRNYWVSTPFEIYIIIKSKRKAA